MATFTGGPLDGQEYDPRPHANHYNCPVVDDTAPFLSYLQGDGKHVTVHADQPKYNFLSVPTFGVGSYDANGNYICTSWRCSNPGCERCPMIHPTPTPTADQEYQDALKAWATAQFPSEGTVKSVEIVHGYDWGYSEYTPGDGLEFGVVIEFDSGTKKRRDYSDDAAVFIQELISFAPTLSP